MKNTIFNDTLMLACVLVLACSDPSSKLQNQSKPDILILLADDLGYSDLHCFGGAAHTPNLDQLAASGMKLTSLYSAAPNCSPSRAGLLTGKDPNKVGVYNYLPVNHPMHVRSEEITLAEVAREKGYRTAHFGKWHISSLNADADLDQPQPGDQGFDYSFGTSNNAHPSHLNPDNFIRNGERVGATDGYSCDLVATEAVAWIRERDHEQPYLAYLAFHEPHKRVASPPTLVAKYSKHGPQHAEYLANVENLDAAIGDVLAALRDKGDLQNTLIVFASDNGSYRYGSNDPLLGGKSFVYEGGIRVPGIISWPAVIDSGRRCDDAVSLLDIMPTLCDIFNIQHPHPEQLAGVSLLPLFDGASLHRPKNLSWFFYRTSPEMAMQQDQLVITGWSTAGSRHTHPFTKPDMDHIKTLTLDTFQLYDLAVDIGQQRPQPLAEHPMSSELKAKLLDRLVDIQAEGPHWSGLPPAKTVKKLKSDWRLLHPTGFSN